MPRNINPKSLANLKPGSASKGGKVEKRLTLLPSTIEAAESLGSHGSKPSVSDGIDRLFRQLPAFKKCKVLLQLIAENPEIAGILVDQIEALLYDLEDLEIEQAYEESVIEGAIEVRSKDGNSSWIV